MLIGICGREGAGKTTIANYLSYGDPDYSSHIEYEYITSVEEYVVNYIYGYFDGIAKRQLLSLLKYFIDEEFEYPESALVPTTSTSGGKWMQYSFAEPLKIVASIIFDINYEILLGYTEESRKLRETISTKNYSVCGKMNGRKCLEYLGTDVLRNHLDPLIWVNIFRRNILSYLKNGTNIVISDI